MSALYECMFDDGTTREYAANTIASNIFLESDADDFSENAMIYDDGACICISIRTFERYYT